MHNVYKIWCEKYDVTTHPHQVKFRKFAGEACQYFGEVFIPPLPRRAPPPLHQSTWSTCQSVEVDAGEFCWRRMQQTSWAMWRRWTTVVRLQRVPQSPGLRRVGADRTQQDVRIGAEQPRGPVTRTAAADGGGRGGGEADAWVAWRPVLARRPARRRPERRRRGWSCVVGYVILDVIVGDVWWTSAQRVRHATPVERHKHHTNSHWHIAVDYSWSGPQLLKLESLSTPTVAWIRTFVAVFCSNFTYKTVKDILTKLRRYQHCRRYRPITGPSAHFIRMCYLCHAATAVSDKEVFSYCAPKI